MLRRSLVVLLIVAASFGTQAQSANAASVVSTPSIPSLNPCTVPLVGDVCNLPGNVASSAGDAVMKGVTTWVTHFAVWVTGQVGELINATSSPDVQAAWFESEYSTMLAIAGALALPMLLLAVIQAVLKQDPAILIRSAFGYLPMAFILAAGAILATQLLIQITDDLSATVLHGLGSSNNLLARVGQAYQQSADDNQNDAVPLFGAFLGALVLAVGSLVLWLELIIRDATIYIAVFFLPLTFVAMIWPATSRYARRLVEFLVAVIFAKLVIISIVALATAALTHSAVMAADATTNGASSVAVSSDHAFERMVAGAALLVLAASSPFALLRVIPLLEGAASSVGQNRSTMGGAAATAGVQNPAAYMRQAMAREPSGYAPAGTASSVSTDGGHASRAGRADGGGPAGNAAESWKTSRVDTATATQASAGSSQGTGATSAASSPAPASPSASSPSASAPPPSPAATVSATRPTGQASDPEPRLSPPPSPETRPDPGRPTEE